MAAATDHGVGLIIRRLERARVAHEVVEHSPTFSALQEAAAARAELRYTLKTLILHDRPGLRMAVLPADRRLDLDKARRLLGGTRHLRLATEDEIRASFPDFDAGALPPLLPVPVVMDVQLLFRRAVLCAGGDHRHSIRLDPRELIRLAEPRVGDICGRFVRG
jgi:Ala-tRNA(Pro) deacylase